MSAIKVDTKHSTRAKFRVRWEVLTLMGKAGNAGTKNPMGMTPTKHDTFSKCKDNHKDRKKDKVLTLMGKT